MWFQAVGSDSYMDAIYSLSLDILYDRALSVSPELADAAHLLDTEHFPTEFHPQPRASGVKRVDGLEVSIGHALQNMYCALT